jgi:hypothetical protein
MPVLEQVSARIPPPLQIRVLGPDVGSPARTDLRRLFPGQRLSAARKNRLEHGGRVVALCGSRVVGLAAYESVDRELRVWDMGVDPQPACEAAVIAGELLDALELACMAGGARRIVLLPRTGLEEAELQRRGYRLLATRGTSPWFDKLFA